MTKRLITLIRIKIFIVLPFLFASCVSYHSHYDRSVRKSFNQIKKDTVFVCNRNEFEEEYQILKRSELFCLTTDSLSKHKVFLKSTIISRPQPCFLGPFMVLAITLGQYPIISENRRIFRFEEDGQLFSYDLKVTRRIWFWDILSWRKSEELAFARELRSERVKNNGLIDSN